MTGPAETAEADCVVIGAGVIGLAAARALALKGHEVILLEAESAIGTGTSSRNSEVIHAGIYYPRGSLKARACVEGKARLYAYLTERGLPHKRCGKLIAATQKDQLGELDAICAKAAANGVTDLELMSARQAMALEPALQCEAALLSPSTGILDAHAYMLALQGDFEDAGGMIAFNTPVIRAEAKPQGGFEIETGGASPIRLSANLLINAAGLAAPHVASLIDGMPQQHLPKAYYARGNYFTLSGRAPFSRLIYPVPEAAGLGIHLTLDMGGQARFGPDVEWIEKPDYEVKEARGESFYAAIRTYWPALKDGALVPAYAGIRPKISGPGEPAADFLVQGPQTHGLPGLVHFFGIESPGLTASLALADEALQALGLQQKN